ncbi:effector-associated domain 2-containing protein [Lentzea sp. NPDC055074]
MTDPGEEGADTDNEVTGDVDGVVFQAGTVHGGVHFYGPAAPPVPAASGDAFTDLVDALLAVPCVRDDEGRRLLLSRLRSEIAHAVPRQSRARLQVIELVRTCLDYEGGIDDLLRVLHEIEGESIPVRRSAEAVHTLLDETPSW